MKNIKAATLARGSRFFVLSGTIVQAYLCYMILSQQIQNWFDTDGSFIDGVSLLERTGYDTKRLRHYTSVTYPPLAVTQRLEKALSDYLELHPIEDSKKKLPAKKEEPPSIVAIRQKAIRIHKLHANAHSEMRIAALREDKRSAYQLANTIMQEYIPTLDSIYDVIRKWEATGELPPPVAVNDVVKDTVKKMQRIASLKSRISRLPKLIGVAKDDSKKQKIEKELVAKKSELNSLKIELGLDE